MNDIKPFRTLVCTPLLIFCCSIALLFASQIAVANQCSQVIVSYDTLEQAAYSHPQDLENSAEKNVFTDSRLATIATSALWLTGVQLLRDPSAPLSNLSDISFQRVLVIDIALTLTSHAIALAQWPWVRKVFSSLNSLTGKSEFWTRATTNTLMGTTVISAGWAATGIDLSWVQVAGAFGLSAVVYPTLQYTKEYLFKNAPLHNKQRNIHLINSVITALPYEERVYTHIAKKSFKNIQLLAKLNGLIKSIQVTKEQLAATESATVQARISYQLMNQRRKLIHQVLKAEIEEKLKRDILFLGAPFDSKEDSLEFQRSIDIEVQKKATRILGLSFIDQAISVGIAGGVLLYSTTHWAATGQLPW